MSTPETRRQIAAIGPFYVKLYQDSAAVMAQARAPLASGRNPDAVVFVPDAKAVATGDLDFLAPGVARAYDEAKYELGR